MAESKVRVAIAGVGNCACSLVQGLTFYRNAKAGEPIPGLMHTVLGGLSIADIEISAAFDVTTGKVGHDVAEAILASPNNTYRFAHVAPLGIAVERGPTLDGLGKFLREEVRESELPAVDVVDVLRTTHTDVLVSYLPVGSQAAGEFYAEAALAAGCGLVNCMPVFIASREDWRRRFEARGLPIIGDDIKSQVGATIVHRVLANLFAERGVRLDHTYQLNFGGNADLMNMLDRERHESTRVSKTQAVMSQLDTPLAPQDVHVGPSDYISWLKDRKWAYVRMEGTSFGNVPLNVELKLEAWDSPNSAGVVIDAVRCIKLALDRKIGGALVGPSSYFMNSPPEQFTDAEARARTRAFIAGDASS